MRGELTAVLEADLPAHGDADELAAILYDRCYAQSILEAPAVRTKTGQDGDLTLALDSANRGRDTWDEGWRIDQMLRDGRVLARKSGALRSFLPGEYLTHRAIGVGPEKSRAISVALPAAMPDLQPGFYFACGENVDSNDKYGPTVRIYWNVSDEGAPRLVEALTGEFNRFQIPFSFKCLNRRASYPRRDAAVLYFSKRHFPIAALVVETLHTKVAPWLSNGTPLFTKRLARGLALAEDPGESFGQHRCRILAQAMMISAGKPLEDRMREIHSQFEARGLSLDRPWLNAAGADDYAYPFPVT